ncbi:hypothetical protein GCM10010174_81720 [Kutzneria viridogrisea]|uniref:Peptidase S1 domain-containing protein n=2 Tax=Kutzneria TaxID=43356 RepID=W5WPE5_9PSEU|nr:hypothetical protein KALB_6701 [Kutzneria albida DSM 43870]MBA8925239.1 secreted trypsin-like serine protease [Kutzneria viridogrisea]
MSKTPVVAALVVTALLAPVVAAQAATPAFRGGEKASVKDYPFIIAGEREGGTRPQGQTCTGSVVAPRKILIAAHCKAAEGEKSFVYGLDDLNASGGFRTKVVDYKTHPKYVNFDQGYDVAVVTTADDIPVPGGAYAKVATSADTELNKPGKTGLGLGYGKKDVDDSAKDVTLEKASLPIVDPSTCTGVGNGVQAATMICAGYSDGHVSILPGDSGGPLVVDGKIVGVASWSRSDFFWYSIYGRLNNDMGDWVKQQIDGGDPTGTPSASFTAQCQSTCKFDGSASSADGATISSYAWDFGDGQTGTGVSTTHTYPARSGTYSATLKVTTDKGKTDSMSRKITCFGFGSQPLCFA